MPNYRLTILFVAQDDEDASDIRDNLVEDLVDVADVDVVGSPHLENCKTQRDL